MASISHDQRASKLQIAVNNPAERINER